jgi:hypothetical protein
MKKLKIIKNKLKNNNNWKKYKKIFIHNQTKLMISKIALIYNKKIKIEKLYEWESSFIEKKIDKNMFKKIFEEINKYCPNINWNSFAKMLWFVYQISRYYKDLKKKRKNIYINQNIVKLNKIKKKYYMNWLNSLNKKDKKFNRKVIKINKIII